MANRVVVAVKGEVGPLVVVAEILAEFVPRNELLAVVHDAADAVAAAVPDNDLMVYRLDCLFMTEGFICVQTYHGTVDSDMTK